MCISIYICMYVYLFLYMYAYIYIYIYMYVYIYVIYIYIYILSYTPIVAIRGPRHIVLNKVTYLTNLDKITESSSSGCGLHSPFILRRASDLSNSDT